MAELNIGQAVKPRYGAATIYDLSYSFGITPTTRTMPMPCGTLSYVDLLSAQLVAANGSTYSTNSFYTDWVSDNAVFSIDDPSDARSIWRLKCGNTDYMYAANALSSTYSGYEFISMNQLWTFGNWRRFLLYSLTNGKYEAVGSALALSNSGNNAIIYYDVTLRNPNTSDIVTVIGSIGAYTTQNSPVNTMCSYQPYDTFTSRGDMKGQITMTETPI